MKTTKVHRAWGASWPDVLLARRTSVFLQRMVFARSVGVLMDTVGTGIVEKYTIAAYAIKKLRREEFLRNLVDNPIPHLFNTDKKVVSAAVTLIGAAIALDIDAERSLKGFMVASLGRGHWEAVHALVAKLAARIS